MYPFIYFCTLIMDTRNESDLQCPNSNCQNCAPVPVINTAFVLNSGTNLEPFLNQVISRMIKSTADPSGSQSASTPATSKSASDIDGTVVTKHIRHCSGHLHHNNKHKPDSFFCCRIKYCECQRSRFIGCFQFLQHYYYYDHVLSSFVYKSFDIYLLNVLSSLATAALYRLQESL